MRSLPLLTVVSLLLVTSCNLFDDSLTVGIELDRPMVTIKGDIVQSLNLRSGEAAILRYPDKLNFSASTAPAAIRKGKNIRLGGYFFGGWKGGNGRMLSADQMNWLAANADVLSLNLYYTSPDNFYNGGISADGVLWLKQQNKDLRFYCMVFGTTLREPLFDPKTMSGWVVRDKNGDEALGVRREWANDTDHLMDLGNEEYAAFFRNFIAEHAKQYHADGVSIDEIMWNGYWGVKVDQMRDYSSVAEIRQACYQWLERIKKDNPTKIIHQAFWTDAQRHTDGVWGEVSFYAYWRAGQKYVIFYEKMNFEEIIQTMSAYGKKDETYIWAAYYDKDDESQLEYALSTYLLGNDGKHVVFQPQPIWDGGYPNNLGGYDISTVMEEYEKHKEYFDVELGEPIGPYYIDKVEDRKVWVRQFERGVVYCNPNH